MTAKHTIKERLGLAGGCCVAATGAMLPLSTALMNLFSGLAFLFWLLSGRCASLPRLVRTNPVARAALLLLAAFVVGLAYSSANLSEGFDMLGKYRKLLLIVVFMPLLAEARAKQWAINAFAAGAAIALAVSYGISLGIVPPHIWQASIMSPITHSVLMAFFAFLAGQKALHKGKARWLWGAAAFLALADILFVVTGRTGQVVVLALALLFAYQRFDWRRRFIGLAVLLIVVGLALVVSKKFSGLIVDTASDIRSYEQGKTFTDVGLRLEWYVNSLELVRQKPLFGHGTGSFAKVYAELAAGKGIIVTDNPHNEYLNIGVQLGLAGVVLFAYLFFVQWQGAGFLSPDDGRLARALVLTMALGCLANSFLMDSHEGHFYAFFSALFFSRLDVEKKAAEQ